VQGRAPTSNDDITLGYAPGFVWLDYADPEYAIYINNDQTVGAAQWAKVCSVGLQENAIRKTDFNAKGDLLVATGNDTFTRLPVGSNGQVLTVDSSTPTGLKWA
jgi:hypothetical protein